MLLRGEDISIGVTVFRRLDYLEQALESAVNQTIPVKVCLYDDGCEDHDGLKRILDRFSGRVMYSRNPENLGLFQNMNQCIWKSPTPWVSVLHDDDALAKDFVERILAVAPKVDQCSLFVGGTTYINFTNHPFYIKNEHPEIEWRHVPVEELAVKNPCSFPGQLMLAATAIKLGGFPEKSLYTGDWELWFKLTQAGGTVQLGANLSYYRSHLDTNRGTTVANRSGRKFACCAAQVKRNLARLRAGGHEPRFDRTQWLHDQSPLYRDLLVYSWTMPGWLLRYNRQLLLLTKRTTYASRALNLVSKIFGNPGLRLAGLARLLGERLGLKMPQTF